MKNLLKRLKGLTLVLLILLAACGSESSGSPGFSFQTPTPTVLPPFAAASNLTPTPDLQANNGASVAPPTATPTTVPPTPIVPPTPTAPREATLSGDDLGIAEWSDTQISWSPNGTMFLLQAGSPNNPLAFYFLVRPPASVVASYKLSRSAFSTFQWSPDNRYLSYIQQDADGGAGAVKLIDTEGIAYQALELFKGPCTGAQWVGSGKVVAACGNAVYLLDTSGKNAPESIFKLDEQGRFPGSPIALSLVARALPSPDGKSVAMFGLQTSLSAKTPIGEIGFLNLETRKFDVLDRNDRPVAPVDWTPDSKYLILRNLTSDWTVSYTYDFYLADPAKLKIARNLTKSNPNCDPVLGKLGCQGVQASTAQTSNIFFAPDGNHFLTTALRYVPRPNVGLQTAERILSGTVSDGKLTQLVENAAGGKVVSLMWLPGGHYFYSFVPEGGGARLFLDGKPLTVSAIQPKPTATPTLNSSLLEGSVYGFQVQTSTSASASTTASPAATPAPTNAASPAPTTTGSVTPAPSSNIVTVVVTTSSGSALTPLAPDLTPLPTLKPIPTPTTAPKVSKDKPLLFGYYASPTGNWVISLEKISDTRAAQYQIRLIPASLK
ncbi:MAG: hypothetical protein HXX08_23180 [Chloroflexi bacterium]|uniref:S9 family peptidase n=1 Tax=Candidatus Chlorohelix allophototropha TaxID=3003348 RepID=A0A8T7MA22_9CHLR|nr:hypothetical protein [Chloroflexota bacterium]WJW68709.1 hypothetical protein OZ401_004325 [Chloroflexota bacterium L227-S17]